MALVLECLRCFSLLSSILKLYWVAKWRLGILVLLPVKFMFALNLAARNQKHHWRPSRPVLSAKWKCIPPVFQMHFLMMTFDGIWREWKRRLMLLHVSWPHSEWLIWRRLMKQLSSSGWEWLQVLLVYTPLYLSHCRSLSFPDVLNCSMCSVLPACSLSLVQNWRDDPNPGKQICITTPSKTRSSLLPIPQIHCPFHLSAGCLMMCHVQTNYIVHKSDFSCILWACQDQNKMQRDYCV